MNGIKLAFRETEKRLQTFYYMHKAPISLARQESQFMTNKLWLYELFGNKMQVDFFIDVETDRSNIMQEAERFFKDRAQIRMLNFFSVSELCDNRLALDTFFCGKAWQSGTKITKIIGLTLKEPLKTEFEKAFSLFHTSVLLANSIKTKVTLSIHPMDFLTMSQNAHNWSSCHNFFAKGNSTAALALMSDSSTIMAYITSDKGDVEILPGLFWNSKKWRQMVHISGQKDMFIQSREYPFSNFNYEDAVSKKLAELIGKSFRPWRQNVGRFYEYTSDMVYQDLYNHGGAMVTEEVTRENPPRGYISIGTEDAYNISNCSKCNQAFLSRKSHPFCACYDNVYKNSDWHPDITYGGGYRGENSDEDEDDYYDEDDDDNDYNEDNDENNENNETIPHLCSIPNCPICHVMTSWLTTERE